MKWHTRDIASRKGIPCFILFAICIYAAATKVLVKLAGVFFNKQVIRNTTRNIFDILKRLNKYIYILV